MRPRSLPDLRSGVLSALAVLAGCAASVPPAQDAPPAEPAAIAAAPVDAPASTEPEAPPDAEPVAVAPPSTEPPVADPPPGPRIGSVRYITWILSRPAHDGRRIGYVREGTSIRLKSPDPVPGQGCRGGWFAAEPYGYVCADSSTTRDMDHPLLAASRVAKQDNAAVTPFRYAYSTGAPMYGRVPTEAEQLKAEGPPAKRPKPQKLGSWASGHEELATEDKIAATDQMPDFLKDGKGSPVHWGKDHRAVRKWIPNGSMLAYTHAFEANGRVWLLSADLTVVPADRVKPFRRSTFKGVKLSESFKLPLAWSRHEPVAKHRKTDAGFEPTGERWPARTPIALGAERVEVGRKAFLATSEAGVYVLESDVAIAKAREKLPISVKDGQKWLDVRIRAGTLVAYEGTTPVFATLISPGAGGVGPYDGTNEELVKLSTTPLGTYRMVWKTRAAAMSPEKGEPQKFWIADVPYTQYFRAPFALHVAYWHEDFGMPKSAGCVNVSPEDGKQLFEWTDPVVPPEWQGAGPSTEAGVGTVIVVAP